MTVRVDAYLTDDDLEAALRADVARGLTSSPKELPPKWFYDERGSQLFDEITRLEEYYPTRREREILEARADDVAATGADTLVELGSGTSEKTRLLLDAMAKAMGIAPRELQSAYPSQVLGTADVAPLEMAAAYSTLAAGGVYHTPR